MRRVLVTGATGYIGGRLVPRLVERGHEVVCMSRSARKVKARPWAQHERVRVVEADAGDQAAVERAMEGCEAAYYLVHSMEAAGESYRARDRALARTFAYAAKTAGVRRIIYLGGLGETGEGLSEHLRSRREVEDELRSTGVDVTVLRAAMIIGSGSASFEILRYLVERLPVMVTPRWVRTECQPIAVRNVLEYLVRCLEVEQTAGKTLDIGGPDVVTYRELMRVMAQELGVPRRVVVPVPVLTPKLSSLWIHLVTPVSARLARPLAEGLRNRVVCRDDEAARLMPQELLGVREAIARALGKVRDEAVETAWMDAGPMPGDPDWAGGTVFVDRRCVPVKAEAQRVYEAACSLGGGKGYYAADWLWRVRGAMDRLMGGPGLRRGKRHPREVRVGDSLDFWRVVEAEPGRVLELRAEMKLPGVATLRFEIGERDGEGCELTQTARFKPRGLLGIMYWYAVVPLHHVVFTGMLRGIARAAEQDAAHEGSIDDSSTADQEETKVV